MIDTREAMDSGPADGSTRGLLEGPAERPGSVLFFGFMTGCAVACAMLLIYIGIGAALSGMSEGMAYCLSFIVAGITGGILQQLWFNYAPCILRVSAPLRYAGFAITYYACLLGCAAFGRWFAFDALRVAIFSVNYLAIFAIISVSFAISGRRRAREYDSRLKEYRERSGKGTDK